MIKIPDLGDEFHEMWTELMLLAETPPAPWVLIGAQMVVVLGWELGREQVRPSRDADVLVNARAVTDGTKRVSRALLTRGYELDGISSTGIGHRFVRGTVSIDVLGPDGIGERADLKTALGARTVRVPGGTQALRRRRDVEIKTRSRSGLLPIPNLLGALLVKVRAIAVADQPEVQRRDTAFLLSLIEDPDEQAVEVSQTERIWLRRHPYFGDPASECYVGLAEARDAAIVYRRLAKLP
ncbi:MAG: hypothetical protein ABIS18_04710 [Actinomycetota bacterium]